jgi:transglutaminase-like putative cysteine protease
MSLENQPARQPGMSSRPSGDNPAGASSSAPQQLRQTSRRLGSSGPRQQISDRNSDQSQASGSSGPLTQTLAILAIGLAIMLHAEAHAEGQLDWAAIAWLVATLGAMFSIAWHMRQQGPNAKWLAATTPLCVAGLLLAALAEWFWGQGSNLAESLQIAWSSVGDLREDVLERVRRPFELILMSAVRNILFVFGCFSLLVRNQRIGLGLSVLLTTFAVTSGYRPTTVAIVIAFASSATAWLFVSHWETVQARLQEEEVGSMVRRLIGAGLLLLLGLGIALWPNNSSRKIRSGPGFMPSSGGSLRPDDSARNGIGDGRFLVAGADRPQSFAPIEDAPFAQDDQPSLYDLFEEEYGDPRPVKRTDAGVPLPLELANRVKQQIEKRTQRASREFSTSRNRRDDQVRKLEDIHSDALFYVAGRVPLHLRAEVFDLFDGTTWYPEEPNPNDWPWQLINSYGKPWLAISTQRTERSFLAEAETHAIKVVKLDTNVIPSPLFLHGVHIDYVDKPDLYQPGPGGLVAMNRSQLPSLVPIHLASRPVDNSKLTTEEVTFLPPRGNQPTAVLPSNLDVDQIRQLAEAWSVGQPRGWPQVEAIRQRLRLEYQLDPLWVPTVEERTGVEQFLFESKRGPDYQFATAMAMLLRSLNYRTRVVSGFYASPAHYDTMREHTAVLPSDVHFWTEVLSGGSDWLTVEAAPGYEVLGPRLSWTEATAAAILATLNRLLKQWMLLLMLAGLGIALYIFRALVLDGVNTARWQLVRWMQPNKVVPATAALLQQRAELSQQPLARSTTHHQWFHRLIRDCQSASESDILKYLQRELDRRIYASTNQAAALNSPPDELALCKQAVKTFDLAWFRRLH